MHEYFNYYFNCRCAEWCPFGFNTETSDDETEEDIRNDTRRRRRIIDVIEEEEAEEFRKTRQTTATTEATEAKETQETKETTGTTQVQLDVAAHEVRIPIDSGHRYESNESSDLCNASATSTDSFICISESSEGDLEYDCRTLP
jgi:hypothetical protein